MIARIDDFSVVTTTSNAMRNRISQVFHYSAKTQPIRILHKGQSAVTAPVVVSVQDSDYHGAPPAPFEKGRDYILILKKAEGEAYVPVHRFQGIMATNPQFTDVSGPMETTSALRFIELFFSTTTAQADWQALAESLIASNDMTDPRRTGVVFWALASMPLSGTAEDFALEVMSSTHSYVAQVGMRQLMKLGSERGLDAIIDRYFKMKRSMDFHTPEGYFLALEYNVLLLTASAKLKPAILRYKARYPEETVLFQEIR
jgi:hypothetical protein